VCRSHPPIPYCYGTVIDPIDTELFEPFDTPDYIHQCVYRPDFVEWYVLCPQSMNPAFCFPQQLKGTHGALSHPGRQFRALDDLNQFADMTVRPVMRSAARYIGGMIVMSMAR
jgi:hypothetical protein